MKRCCLICALAFIAMVSACRTEEAASARETPVQETAAVEEVCEEPFSAADSIDSEFAKFMHKWNIRGISLSVMRNDSLLYSKGYGLADELTGEEMSTRTILRIASVSKLLTAAGIMLLVDRGQLELSDYVFGENGILKEFNSDIRDERYFEITVDNLLRHEGGFSSKRYDPMFSGTRNMQRFRLKTPPDARKLASLLVGDRLAYYPGLKCEYSNFGYLLLSLVIENVTGEDYESWMQKNLLEPAGCHDMHIAYNYYEQRHPNETRYHMQKGDPKVPEYNCSGKLVQRCYGGNDLRLLSGAGAWVASSAELARFVAAIDGNPVVRDVISEESVADMTRWYDNCSYSLGWNSTTSWGGWSRTGTLAATNALVKCYPDGECWVMITNSNVYWGSKFSKYTNRICNKCHDCYSSRLPLQDLFSN